MTIIISIVVLGVIILIHELGHFLTARCFSMPVEEFSIGMGPQVYSYTGEKTVYSFRAIPLGGYVNIEGMEFGTEVKNGFATKPAYQRLIVLGAGVFMNFLLALFLLTGLHYHSGEVSVSQEAIVGKVVEQSPAWQHLQEGDRIVQIEGQPVLEWKDIHTLLSEKARVEILIERGEEEKFLSIELLEEGGKHYLGIYPRLEKQSLGFLESIQKAGTSFYKMLSDMLVGLWNMLRGKVSLKEISGPIGILQVVGDASQEGFLSLLWLTVFLSVNVGLLNLLPLPALDGGRILFVVMELLHIPFHKKMEEKIHKIGLIVLISFILYISLQDILHLF